jgi:hypothetical protein
MPYSSGPRRSYPTPYLKWTFLMLRSPPLNHIYLWSGWIGKLNTRRVEARGHPHPLPEVFLRITHISETILSILTKLCPNVPWVILFQSYVQYVWPKEGPKRGPKMINYLKIVFLLTSNARRLILGT